MCALALVEPLREPLIDRLTKAIEQSVTSVSSVAADTVNWFIDSTLGAFASIVDQVVQLIVTMRVSAMVALMMRLLLPAIGNTVKQTTDLLMAQLSQTTEMYAAVMQLLSSDSVSEAEVLDMMQSLMSFNVDTNI